MNSCRKFVCVFLSVLIVSLVSVPAHAAEENAMLNLTNQIEVSNDILFDYMLDESQTRSTNTKSGTVYGRFYRRSNGETLARVQLTVNFRYDGTTVSAYSSDATWSQVVEGWDVSVGNTTLSSTGVNASGTTPFSLYYQGTYNTSLTAIVYCTKDGTISTVIN